MLRMQWQRKTIVSYGLAAFMAILAGALSGCRLQQPELETTAPRSVPKPVSKPGSLSRPPARGDQILFMIYSGLSRGDGDIYVINPDSSGRKRLVQRLTQGGGSGDPSYNSDGSKIVFYFWLPDGPGKETGSYEIYTMNADGTNRKRLTHSREEKTAPTYSRDGSKIAFVIIRHDNFNDMDEANPEICVMNADGSGQKRLTNNPIDKGQVWDGHPIFSPDERQIAFTHLSQFVGESQISTMNIDGSDVRRLAYGIDPMWTSDGSKIVFNYKHQDNYAIALMNADGSGQRQLSKKEENDHFGPALSPDGQRIAFSNRPNRFSPGGSIPKSYIELMDINGAHRMCLTDPKERGYAQEYSPLWSPDSRRIAFVSEDNSFTSGPARASGIYVVNADGSHLKRIARKGQPITWRPRPSMESGKSMPRR